MVVKRLIAAFMGLGLLGGLLLGLLATTGHASAAAPAPPKHPAQSGSSPARPAGPSGAKQKAAPAGGQGAFLGARGPHGAGEWQGTIQSVSGGTLTVTGPRKIVTDTLTVQTTAGTVVLKNGLAAVADLKAGDTVRVSGQHAARPAGSTPQATRPALTAAVIYVPGANDALIAGRVQAVSGSTVTLREGLAGKQVSVGASTAYRVLGTAGAAPTTGSLSDLKAGTEVLLYGPKAAQGQTASVVLILPAAQKATGPGK